MDSFFPKEPIELTSEVMAWIVLIGIIYFIFWRFCKNFPKAVKPLAFMWVKDVELRSYSLLQLVISIFWLKTVNESTHPGLQAAIKALDPLAKWFLALVVVLLGSSFIFKLVIVGFTYVRSTQA